MSSQSNSLRLPLRKAIILGLVGWLLSFCRFPTPVSLNKGTTWDRFQAKTLFYSQTLEHVLGIREEYDYAALHAMYHRILGNNTLKQKPSLDPILEIDAQDPQWKTSFEKLYVNKLGTDVSKPIVVRGLTYAETEIFPHVNSWNIEYFRDEMYGDTEIPVFTNMSLDRSAVMMPFTEYVKNMNNESNYLYAKAMPDVSGQIKAGIPDSYMTQLLGLQWEHKAQVFMDGGKSASGHVAFVGGKHCKTRMHSDFGTSSFFQVQGRKHWIFYPPSEMMILYPNAHNLNVAYNAALDVFNPDLEQFPFYGLAKGVEVILQPGDVLFFPSFWWHAVENLDEVTIGVDFAVVDFFNSMKTNTVLAIGSFFNPKIFLNVLYSRLIVGGEDAVRNLFFDSYMKKT